MTLAQTQRTRLRRFCPEDLAAFQAYRRDPDVARYQDCAAMTNDQAATFLSDMATCDLLRPGHWTQIAISEPASDALIGDMGLHLSADGTEAEVGITLAANHQRQGHGTTALALAFDLIWAQSDARCIRAFADQRNVASVTLFQRSRMQHTGSEQADDGVTEETFFLLRP